METALEEVLRRLALLEDEKAILQTMNRYGHCTDYGLGQEFASLFTEDGLLQYFGRDGVPFSKKEGRAELAAFVVAKPRPGRYDKHIFFSPVIAISGGEASVKSYFALLQVPADRPGVAAYGRYEDSLVKQDGRWLFRRRLAYVETPIPA